MAGDYSTIYLVSMTLMYIIFILLNINGVKWASFWESRKRKNQSVWPEMFFGAAWQNQLSISVVMLDKYICDDSASK